MDAQHFVAAFKAEKDWFLDHFTNHPNKRIQALKLTPDQQQVLDMLLNDVLRDVFYTILMGLDGAASIGGIQQGYTISDEQGNVITKCGDGELEGYAYDAFQAQ